MGQAAERDVLLVLTRGAAMRPCACASSEFVRKVLTIGGREAIAARRGTPKVLLLNGSHDRETSMRSGSGGGMTAVDIVHAVSSRAPLMASCWQLVPPYPNQHCLLLMLQYASFQAPHGVFCFAVQLTDALNRRYSPRGSSLQHTAADYITHILAPAGGAIHIDVDELAAMGITHVMEVSSCSQRHELGPIQWHTKNSLMREAVAPAGLLRLDGAAYCCADCCHCFTCSRADRF